MSLGAEKEQREAEQHEREELRAHDDERRKAADEHQQDDKGARCIGRAQSTHARGEQGKRRACTQELGEQQASIPTDGLQGVKDELAEDRHVDPVDRRCRGIGNARRNRTLCEDRTGPSAQGDGKPGKPGALRLTLHARVIGLETRPL